MNSTKPGLPTVIRAKDVPWHALEAREGIFTKSMWFGDDAARRYIHAQLGRTGPNAMSPRHKHTFDQLRFFPEGEAKFGDAVYQPGDCVYFPEGVPYGPQVGYNGLDSTQIVLQWSGPAAIYYPSPDEQAGAKRVLENTGDFRGGVYYPHAGRPKDGFEALLEEITAAPVAYAAPRYDAPIRMRTAAFADIPHADDERISTRQLARFNECGPGVELMTVRAGATLLLRAATAERIAVLLRGTATYGEQLIEGVSCAYHTRGSQSDPLHAHDDCTVLLVSFH